MPASASGSRRTTAKPPSAGSDQAGPSTTSAGLAATDASAASVLRTLLADPDSRDMLKALMNDGAQAVVAAVTPPPGPSRLTLPPDPRKPANLQPVRLSSDRPTPAAVVYDDEVFSIDDVSYYMPSDPPQWWATEYLADMASGNAMVAAGAEVTMYKRMLGEGGWGALREYSRTGKLTKREYRQVITIISTALLGQDDESPKDA